MAFQFPASPAIGDQFTPIVGRTYEWNGTGWVMLGLNPASVYPPAVIVPYAGVGSPLPFQGWLLCDGSSQLTASYPALFAVIGYTYGGAGASFNLPDLRGRVIAGVDNMGGVAAGRMTPLQALGGATGAQTVALITANLPAHNHPVTDPGHNHNITDPGHTHSLPSVYSAVGGATNITTTAPAVSLATVTGSNTTGITIQNKVTGLTVGNTGSGTAHANVQPSLMLNYIIKT